MNLRIPRAQALGLAVALAVALALFLFFLARFGGPSIRLSSPYSISATFGDTRGLSPGSEVLVRGVDVGQVDDIELEGGRARVTLALDPTVAPLRRDATVQVGEKTLFGESYVDLDPGRAGARDLPSGSALAASRVLPPSVDVDQALKVLNGPARRDLGDVLRTLGDGARSPAAGDQIGQTYAQLARLTGRLRGLADTLHGQEGDIATGVQDADAVVSTLGRRETQLRTIVSAGRATLHSLASRSDALGSGLSELPGLLLAARTTLADATPLIGEARPVAEQLAAAAPPLSAALKQVPASVRDANSLLAGVSRLRSVALPFLQRAADVTSLAQPAVGPLGDALRNVVPIVRYLSQRRDTVAAWFSNTADLGSSRDAKGFFARFFVSFEPGTAFGTPGDFENNSYTAPHDAAHNQPYSGYPRLRAYHPRDKEARP